MKVLICPPQAYMNSVVPQQNRRKRSFFRAYGNGYGYRPQQGGPPYGYPPQNGYNGYGYNPQLPTNYAQGND